MQAMGRLTPDDLGFLFRVCSLHRLNGSLSMTLTISLSALKLTQRATVLVCIER
jgi:hypothetical protein